MKKYSIVYEKKNLIGDDGDDDMNIMIKISIITTCIR